MWFRKAPEELEDLAEVLGEAGPEPVATRTPPSPGVQQPATIDTPSERPGLAAATTPAAAAAVAAPPAAADDAPLPVSSSSPLPALASPEKPGEQHDVAASSDAAASGWLPSVAAWLPSSRVAPAAGGDQQPQPQQLEQQPQQQEAHQPAPKTSWADYLPAASSLPLLPRLLGSGGQSAPAVHVPAGGLPATNDGAATPATANTSSSGGSGSLLGLASAAQHQLTAACHQAAEQLGSVGSTAVGASLLGATVGGICAGPLGAAAGAKSGAAWVAAGALGGAAVRQLKDGSHVAGAAADGGPVERELQAIRSSGSGGGTAGGGEAGRSEPSDAPAEAER